MKTVCKFSLNRIVDYGSDSKEYGFQAVYDKEGIPEDQQFTKYTPSGTLTVYICNPAVNAMFDGQVGKKFYLTIEEAE